MEVREAFMQLQLGTWIDLWDVKKRDKKLEEKDFITVEGYRKRKKFNFKDKY